MSEESEENYEKASYEQNHEDDKTWIFELQTSTLILTRLGRWHALQDSPLSNSTA